MTIEQFFKIAEPHVAFFNAFSLTHDLIGKAAADHICYKCGSRRTFEQIRALFEYESVYMYQSIISDRPIAYIRFKKGIETELGIIYYLELSDQKPDGSQKEGFDHIEVYPVSQSYDELVQKLAKDVPVMHKERPHHTTDDIEMEHGFLFRCTRGPLITKIKASEMI